MRSPTCSPGARRWAGRHACSPSSATSSATRTGSTGRWPQTPPRWSPTCGERATPTGRPGTPWSTSAADRLLRLGILQGGLGLRRCRAGPVGDARRRARSPRRTGNLRPRLRDGVAVRRRQRRRVLVVERGRARCAALAPRRGDAAGDPSRRAGDPVLHRVARPVRRPRDGSDALPRRARAAARYTRKHGRPPKNNFGSSLFAVSAADGLCWAAGTGARVAAFPRYHPRWAWWLTSVPGVRELAVSNLVLVLQPR